MCNKKTFMFVYILMQLKIPFILLIKFIEGPVSLVRTYLHPKNNIRQSDFHILISEDFFGLALLLNHL